MFINGSMHFFFLELKLELTTRAAVCDAGNTCNYTTGAG